MNKKAISLTPAEWQLMECLWEKSPRSGREAVDDLRERAGWSRSTTLTMLRRMSEKGLIARNSDREPFIYSPSVQRSDAVKEETRSFLDRVYKGSVSMMISAMTKEQALSNEEVDELRKILRQLEGNDK